MSLASLHSSAVLCAAIVLTLSGCDASPPPFPDVEPFRGLVDDIQFGQRASEVRDSRPVVINEDWEMMEFVGSEEWLYLFDLQADSGPPPTRARLTGVQMRKEFWDTTGLWTAWAERSARYGAFTGADPVCSRVTTGRLTITRVDVPGPVQLSVGAQILLGADGQSFEGWLISGAEVVAADSVSAWSAEGHRGAQGTAQTGRAVREYSEVPLGR